MAAVADLYTPELVDLKYLRGNDLEPLLNEEKLTWRSLLSWDFTASADLVARFVRMQALTGHALVVADRVVGYSYYVCEDQKGLIGDLFVSREYANTENEDLLLSAGLQAMVSTQRLQRIEAQLMMLRGPFERHLPLPGSAFAFPRNFMLAELSDVAELPPDPRALPYSFDKWDESCQEEAAALIAAAYQDHVDSSINDQYNSYLGARRFLTNIVQYPGCGTFFTPASLVARNAAGRICGLVLGSVVSPEAGHITQICVSPDAQGRGIGYDLLRRSLMVFKENGCEKTSLTVTAANTGAIALYHRMGFRAVRRFAAYVWQGF